MQWNVNKLLDIYYKTKEIYEKDPNNLENTIIFYNVSCMLKYKNVIKQIDKVSFKGPRERYEDKNIFLEENNNLILDICTRYSSKIRSNSRLFSYHRININDSIKLILEFLKVYNKDYIYYLNYMLDNNLIEYNKKNIDKSTAKGITFKVGENEGSYIYTKYDKTVKSTIVLLHEITHAIKFWYLNNKENINVSGSLFCETYPVFMELAFTNYLKNTKYEDDAYCYEYELIDNFLCNLEVYDLKGGKTNDYYLLKCIYSYLAAFNYFINYLDNNDNKEIERFDLLVGNISDKELFNMLDSNLVDMPSKVIKNHNRVDYNNSSLKW